jgi:hypothetical protein
VSVSIEQARAAKALAKSALVGVPGIVGIGLTKLGDDYALKVNLLEPLPGDVHVPDQVAGVPVRVEVVGVIRKRRGAGQPPGRAPYSGRQKSR